jgi:hypothetical protein
MTVAVPSRGVRLPKGSSEPVGGRDKRVRTDLGFADRKAQEAEAAWTKTRTDQVW